MVGSEVPNCKSRVETKDGNFSVYRKFSSMAEGIIIRLGTRDDMPKVVELIQELAIYEGVPNVPKITAEDFIRDGFDSTPSWFFTLMAVDRDNKIVGYALCHRAYSSWVGRSMYIEDIYVEPALRGHKLGHQIFKELCKICVLEGAAQIDWHVLVDNKLAIDFYERHGGYDLCKKEGRTAYRLNKADIETVASN